MEQENNLKQELLKQMEKDSSEVLDISVSSGSKIIEKHKTRLRRRKWIAVTGWLITMLYAIAMHNLKDFLLKHNIGGVLTRNEFRFIRWSDTCLLVLIIIAVLLTFLLYSKSRTLTILQISAKLANLEEHLKKMTQDK